MPRTPRRLIACGYSSAPECETAIGKGGVCFVDPDYAVNVEARCAANAIAGDRLGTWRRNVG